SPKLLSPNMVHVDPPSIHHIPKASWKMALSDHSLIMTKDVGFSWVIALWARCSQLSAVRGDKAVRSTDGLNCRNFPGDRPPLPFMYTWAPSSSFQLLFSTDWQQVCYLEQLIENNKKQESSNLENSIKQVRDEASSQKVHGVFRKMF
ncbi:hypothetical protein JTE90_009821, partial [Oedothorax gibbosus]